DGIRGFHVTGVQTCALPIFRKEAEQRAIRSGAVKGSIEVTVDMDPDKNIVRATAVGSTDVKQGQSLKPDLRDEELAQIAADHFRSEERREGKRVDLGGGRIA